MKLKRVWVPARAYRVERIWNTNPICWLFGHEMSLLYPSRMAGTGDLHKWECERCGRHMGTMGPFLNEEAFFFWGRCDDILERTKQWKIDQAEVEARIKRRD